MMTFHFILCFVFSSLPFFSHFRDAMIKWDFPLFNFYFLSFPFFHLPFPSPPSFTLFSLFWVQYDVCLFFFPFFLDVMYFVFVNMIVYYKNMALFISICSCVLLWFFDQCYAPSCHLLLLVGNRFLVIDPAKGLGSCPPASRILSCSSLWESPLRDLGPFVVIRTPRALNGFVLHSLPVLRPVCASLSRPLGISHLLVSTSPFVHFFLPFVPLSPLHPFFARGVTERGVGCLWTAMLGWSPHQILVLRDRAGLLRMRSGAITSAFGRWRQTPTKWRIQ